MEGSSKRATWLPWTAAGCLAVLSCGLAYERFHLRLLADDFRLRDQAQQRELDNVQGREIALRRLLDASGKDKGDALSQIKITILASKLKEAPEAMAAVAWDCGKQRGILKMVNMPATGADEDYQLWIIDPGEKEPVSAGIFDGGTGGGFQPAQPVAKVDGFVISIEKKGGAPGRPGQIVLAGG